MTDKGAVIKCCYLAQIKWTTIIKTKQIYYKNESGDTNKCTHNPNISNKKKLINDTNFKIILCISCIKAKLLVQNRTFNMCSYQFSQQIFSLSNMTAHQQCSPAGQQFLRCWQVREHLIWTCPCDLDLANESVHLSRKCTSYIILIAFTEWKSY